MRTNFEPINEMRRATQPLIGVLARNIAIGALAGFLAGIVTGGLGSRVAMRLVAVTAGSDMQGVLTDQEVPVGEITAGGTFFLILFGGFMGRHRRPHLRWVTALGSRYR
jgi:hypothetical protein